MVKVKKQALVEKLVAHATVEALTKVVLYRLSRRNEMPHDPVVLRPGEHGVGGELVNWKKKYDGMQPPEMRRLKQLEDENSRLKKIVADLSLDREMLQDVIRRKL
jgi:putative transposase